MIGRLPHISDNLGVHCVVLNVYWILTKLSKEGRIKERYLIWILLLRC